MSADGTGMIGTGELTVLEETVEHALRTGDERRLRVLGYGEISTVLGWPPDEPRVVCKRLPPFPSRAAADAYADTFARYLEALATRGLRVVASEPVVLDRPGGTVVHCVQPALPADTIAPAFVHAGAGPAVAEALFEQIVDHAVAVAGDGIFFDGQLSNWAVTAEGVAYLDVTTPFLRRPDGTEELDVALLTAALPWALRRPVERWVAPGILARYRAPRTVLLDLAANLVKERLDPWIPVVLEHANAHLDEPLTEAEVRADYARDARTWETLLRLRRLDRAWQRRVRRRPCRFLLPGPIER